uniref:Uncharacterized protein n=1 Tax=Triticum urartu TaxID=4572 RepID=A0A8R7TSE7_TRIUA
MERGEGEGPVALPLELGHGGEEVGPEEAAEGRGGRAAGGRRGAVGGGEALEGLHGVDGLRGEGAAALEWAAVVARAAGDGPGPGPGRGARGRRGRRARQEEERHHGRRGWELSGGEWSCGGREHDEEERG